MSTTTTEKQPLFELRRVVATPGALAALEEADQRPEEFLARHVAGDWGEVSEKDKPENDFSVENGFRILSSCRTNKGVKFWIIPEHDRSVTTNLTDGFLDPGQTC
jgi:hypothetical protein